MGDWKRYDKVEAILVGVSALLPAGGGKPPRAKVQLQGKRAHPTAATIENPPAELAEWTSQRVILSEVSVGTHATFARGVRLVAPAQPGLTGVGDVVAEMAAFRQALGGAPVGAATTPQHPEAPRAAQGSVGAPVAPPAPANVGVGDEAYRLRDILAQAKVALGAGQRLAEAGGYPPEAAPTLAVVVALLAVGARLPLTTWDLGTVATAMPVAPPVPAAEAGEKEHDA